MLDLSKQQLILLALLVSFVTSLATGIVTVSLLDQAPTGVTRTVSQVIEKTIQQALPQNAAVASATTTIIDQSAVAVSNVRQSVVRIESSDGKVVGGLGLIMSKDGVILTDKSVIAGLADYRAVLPDTSTLTITVIQSQINGNIVILAPAEAVSLGQRRKFVPITFAPSANLGQTVFSLSGTSTSVLGQGIITEANDATGAEPNSTVKTSIANSKTTSGSPLFDLSGAVIGIRLANNNSSEGADFYPVAQLQNIIPKNR